MADTIRIATQGDDLGANETTNRAFAEAFHQGVLRNAAVLACGPSIEHAAKLLAKEKGLCFVLHTAVNAEWTNVRWGPVAGADKVPSLVDDTGNFFRTTVETWNNKPQVEHILIELQAQLDRARDLGFDIKLADAHMGWTWIFNEDEPKYHDWRHRNGLIDRPVYSPLPKVECMADPVQRLMLQLTRAVAGQYLIISHPAYDNAETRALGHPGYEGDLVATSRDWERRIYCDPRIVQFFKDHHIHPIRHDEADRS